MHTVIVSTLATCDFLAYHSFSRLTLRCLQGFSLNMLTLLVKRLKHPGWALTEGTMLGPVLIKPHGVSSTSCFPASGRHFTDTELSFVMSFLERGPDW